MLLVVVSLEAVGDNEWLVERSEILDQCRRCLNDVGVQPQNPRSIRTKSGKEQRVASLGHDCAAGLLVLKLMTLAFILGHNGRLEILSQNDDTLEPFGFTAMLLRLVDKLLQFGGGLVALLGLGEDETQCDKFMRIAQSQEILPVARIKTGHGSQNKDVLPVLYRRGGDGDIVKVVMHNGWWL